MSCVALIAVVAAVIGVVTSVALHSYLEHQVDDQLSAALDREHGRGLQFVAAPGQPLNTVGLRGGTGARSVEAAGARPEAHLVPLDAAQAQALAGVAKDGKPHTVTVPGLGQYRVTAGNGKRDGNGSGPGAPAPGPAAYGSLDGGSPGADAAAADVAADAEGPGGGGQARDVVLGFPSQGVQETVRTLVVVVVCVTLAALVAAGLAGNALVGAALRPLRRIAATATRVSELPLDRGEVALHERVPQADSRTEVGQVGAALNRMLGHVGSALAVRQESETRVRRFVADASHELRTPLASIRGYAELTRRGGEAATAGPDTRYALGRIESEATRMTGLVEDLLLLARLDAGTEGAGGAAGTGAGVRLGAGPGVGPGAGAGASLSWESTDLVPLVVDAVSDARAAGQEHVWRLELPDEPVIVRGDPARLQQVLVNLLGNARTHTPAGTRVTARVREEKEGRVLVEVRDDGPGIAPELMGRVFERFARGDVARGRVLAVARVGEMGADVVRVTGAVSAAGGADAAEVAGTEGAEGAAGATNALGAARAAGAMSAADEAGVMGAAEVAIAAGVADMTVAVDAAIVAGVTGAAEAAGAAGVTVAAGAMSGTCAAGAMSGTCAPVAPRAPRVPRAPVASPASTGLGLAIVRAVVEAHGGEVGVESVPGRTVFSVWLPGE